jgi:hypothetical protein
MKLYVTKPHQRWVEAKPCQGCYHNPDDYTPFNARWIVELNDLGDLMALAREVKHSLIVHPVKPEAERVPDVDYDLNAITIYDDWME